MEERQAARLAFGIVWLIAFSALVWNLFGWGEPLAGLYPVGSQYEIGFPTLGARLLDRFPSLCISWMDGGTAAYWR